MPDMLFNTAEMSEGNKEIRILLPTCSSPLLGTLPQQLPFSFTQLSIASFE